MRGMGQGVKRRRISSPGFLQEEWRKGGRQEERAREAAANRLTITHSRTLYNAFRMSSLCLILVTIAIFERSRGGPIGYNLGDNRGWAIGSL